jgi:N-methylhydantoinase A/acetophenone carboxylase
MYSIDIDIGGTFTDGFFTDGAEVRTEKVLSTPHDITEGFMNCVAAGAAAFGLDMGDFLRRTAVTRVSTTVGTNLLVQRAGPQLGLLVTKGHEADLYGRAAAPVLDRFVRSDMVIGVAEAVDDRGRVATPPDQSEVLRAIRRLVESNARMIVVSFANAWRNPENERRVRDIVRSRYPVHYLRSVPLQIGTEVIHVSDDHARANSAIFNAYIHSEMARTLYRAEDKLRAAGFPRPLLVVHASGGNARVAKTVALNTLHSGPAVAARGAAFVSRMLGLDDVVTTDMGGTSLDVAVIQKGAESFRSLPSVEGVAIATPMIDVESVGAGGGSIASIKDGALKVGPESAGSVPGPVSYGKGGLEPTVTDANLILGYIDPDYFLGGRMKLDSAAAGRAIERRLARQLGATVEEAAFSIRETINRQMAAEAALRIRQFGADAKGFTLFSFGGGGPLHACRMAELAGISRVVAFPYGSVFSAFGGSTTSVRHSYFRTLGIPAARAAEVDALVAEFRRQALRDMSGEGFAAKDVDLAVEIAVLRNGATKLHKLDGKTAGTRGSIGSRLEKSRGTIESVQLTAETEIDRWTPRKLAAGRGAPPKKGARDIRWERGKATATPVYDRFALRPGHRLAGPALVEGPDTVYAVDPGWTLAVDAYGNFVLTQD